MTLRWFLRSASRTPWLFLVPLLPSGPCSARKAVLSLASLSPRCLSPHQSGLSLTCFMVLLLCRLHLPLPLSSRVCRCGRLLDCFGHPSCSRARVLGRRGFTLESVVARVCCEAEAANVFLRGCHFFLPMVSHSVAVPRWMVCPSAQGAPANPMEVCGGWWSATL